MVLTHESLRSARSVRPVHDRQPIPTDTLRLKEDKVNIGQAEEQAQTRIRQHMRLYPRTLPAASANSTSPIPKPKTPTFPAVVGGLQVVVAIASAAGLNLAYRWWTAK
jgi:hypothetical protein